MGRPPKGDALTAAERKARWKAKRNANQGTVTKTPGTGTGTPVTKTRVLRRSDPLSETIEPLTKLEAVAKAVAVVEVGLPKRPVKASLLNTGLKTAPLLSTGGRVVPLRDEGPEVARVLVELRSLAHQLYKEHKTSALVTNRIAMFTGRRGTVDGAGGLEPGTLAELRANIEQQLDDLHVEAGVGSEARSRILALRGLA